MKKHLLLLIFIPFVSIDSRAQSMPTLGDIYNFDIGDEFQSRAPLALPNVARTVISGKFFSATNDTVFYIRQNDNYYTTSQGGMPPVLTYHTSSFTDTIYYTNLTAPVSSLITYLIDDSCDTSHDSVYASSSYCGAQVYENNTCTNCCFEGDSYENIYGTGIGRLYYYHQNPGNMYQEKWEQFFYKKAVSGDSCGSPDRTYYAGLANIQPLAKIALSPNPTSDKLYISAVDHAITIQLYDALGVMYISTSRDTDGVLDLSALPEGIYLLTLQDKAGVRTFKVVKN